MPKISVIVPVYNVESYLREALDSLVGQSLKDIEIICVNDGSTDNSLQILHEYAAKDDRLKIIDKPNAGVSAARNDGMAAATGEYITFADGDDWLKSTAYEEIYKQLGDNRPDMVIFGYYESVEGDVSEAAWNNILRKDWGNSGIPLDVQILRLGNTVWNHFYRLDFIRKHGLEFPVGVAIAEDGLFNIQCFLKKPVIQTLSGAYYFYRRFREGSTLTSGISLDKVLEQKRYCDKSSFYQQLDDNVRVMVDLKIAGSLVFRYKLLDQGSLSVNRPILQEYKKYLDKKYPKSVLSSYVEYRGLRKATQRSRSSDMRRDFLENIFSVKNSSDKRHKVITVLGIKLKISRRKK
uniref:Glycosyltransferase 2-like domain-containing protein n=1 Tax=uncultured Alphaproteobacteria bacterium TaxID=91750 RepID=A0A6G8F352_9PROT|nr:hypothetical protein PlAlph_5580 [uncultured Alphaproteobacteria bacterium]